MNIVFVGDVVGACGRRALREQIGLLRERYAPHFLIVNGENAAAGKGITRAIAKELFSLGVHAITMGNHTWDQKELLDWIDDEPRLVRPANYPDGTPGVGVTMLHQGTYTLAVMNVMGRTFMQPIDCPFRTFEQQIASLPRVPIFVDFHAEATSEKVAFGLFADGRASAIVGTHTHVQTNDARVLPGGTAVITDVGMTGAQNGILGVEREAVITKFLTQMPVRFVTAEGPYMLHGVHVHVDVQTRTSTRIAPIRIYEGEFVMH
jgi:metallophosphoesterase (TIGR00282 family)